MPLSFENPRAVDRPPLTSPLGKGGLRGVIRGLRVSGLSKPPESELARQQLNREDRDVELINHPG